MTIKERIEKIKPYFREMQVKPVGDIQAVYVIVVFPRNWIIDDEIETKFGITVSEGTNYGEYYFGTDIESGEEVLFDAIEYNIEKMKEAIERAQLLASKTKELKEIFENENITIEQLRTLVFKYDGLPLNTFENTYTAIMNSQEEKKETEKENKNYKKSK